MIIQLYNVAHIDVYTTLSKLHKNTEKNKDKTLTSIISKSWNMDLGRSSTEPFNYSKDIAIYWLS